MYNIGYDMSKNYKRTVQVYHKNVEQGNARVQNNLGNNEGVLMWHRRSAEQDDVLHSI
jgi:hypothetical protein